MAGPEPVDWWDGTKYANREFGQFMFGRAKDGSNFPRVGRWNIRDMQPAWLGIAYEQINDDEYVEPNRDRASTYFKLLLRMSAKYAYDAHLDLHQTEFERSKYNASVVLPFSQKDLPEPVRTANQQLGDFIVKALRDGGGTPMPEARPLDYAEDQIRFFRRGLGRHLPHAAGNDDRDSEQQRPHASPRADAVDGVGHSGRHQFLSRGQARPVKRRQSHDRVLTWRWALARNSGLIVTPQPGPSGMATRPSRTSRAG